MNHAKYVFENVFEQQQTFSMGSWKNGFKSKLALNLKRIKSSFDLKS